MILTVTAPARRDDYPISVSEVESRLGVSGQTARITGLVESIRDRFSDELGFDMRRQSYSMSFPTPNGRRELILPVSVVDRDQFVVTVSGDVVEAHMKAGGVLERSAGFGYNFEPDAHTVTFVGGWVMPTRVFDHDATARDLGDFVRAEASARSRFLFEVTTAGTPDASAPTWPTTAGATVTSGTVVYTARDAAELPGHIQELAWQAAADAWRRKDGEDGVLTARIDGFSETRSSEQAYSEVGMPALVKRALGRYRTKVAA